MKLIAALLTMIVLPAYALIQLENGSYEVRPVDRFGNVQICHFDIENRQEEKALILNVLDCPPQIIDVPLFNFDGDDFYISEKVPATSSSREGHKMYEIHPITATQFKMVSYRQYANGQTDRPRSIIATKK